MSELAGTGALVRLALRRDRVRLPLWAITAAIYAPVLQAPAIEALYPTPADLQRAVGDFGANATFRMLYGEIPSVTVAGVTAWRTSFLLVVLAIATALTVIRHTRADEQSGRAELLRATGVGRDAPLAAALLVAVGTSVAIGAATGGLMAVQGYDGAGSLAFGAAIAAAGATFAAVGAVGAQLAEGAGAARTIALTTLAAAYLVRALGDAQVDGSASWLSWASPIGWLHLLRAYGDERWWVLLLPLLLTAGLVALAVALSARRDFAAGLLPPRPGPATAAARFRSPLALAWRIHRASVLGWAVGLGLVGAVLGGAATGAEDLLRDSPGLHDVIERLGGAQILTDAFLAAVFGFVGLLAAAQAIQAVLRIRTEEEDGRAEAVLVTPVGRTRWAAGHVLLVAVGPAASVLAAGLVGAVVFGLADGDLGGDLPLVVRAALVQLPAVWVLAGAAIALVGVLPRWSSAAWALLSACFLVGQVGAALDLPQAVLDVSPFSHVPATSGQGLVVPLVALGAVAAALAGTGLRAFARRDLG